VQGRPAAGKHGGQDGACRTISGQGSTKCIGRARARADKDKFLRLPEQRLKNLNFMRATKREGYTDGSYLQAVCDREQQVTPG